MSLKAIVTDGRGAILRDGLWRRGRIITYSPECWKPWKGGDEVVVHEFRAQDEDDFMLYPWDENGDLYEKTVKTAFTIYVDSTPGASEESDTGDGTSSNPFSCLNSALHFLEPPSFSETRRVSKALATGCYCGGTPVVKIILTGKVDYACTHTIVWAHVYIEGRDGAEFEVKSDYGYNWRFGDTLKNCTVRVTGNEYYGHEYRPPVLENCRFYSSYGFGLPALEFMVDVLLFESEFHLTYAGSEEDIWLGFLYESAIYIEAGFPPPSTDPEEYDHVFWIGGVNSCHNFYRSNRHAAIICPQSQRFNSTIGGNADWD